MSDQGVDLAPPFEDEDSYRNGENPLRSKVIDSTEPPSLDQDVYFFESDHLALKGNQDYQMLLRTVAILEAQRIKAIQDLDKLIEIQGQALRDPIHFVEKLQNGENWGIPPPQKVASLPTIHWENYTSSVDPGSFGLHKHMTRNKRPVSSSCDAAPSEASNSTEEKTTGGLRPTVVRGRVKDRSKPSSFNQLWTVEEQKRLESLLLEYPPEEVEARRWQKIASALGNRTLHQVASRVQKYFIKLAKAGLPVPGRIPNVNHYSKKGAHRHQRLNRFYYQPSTFLASYEPPVYMSEEDEDSMSYDADSVSSNHDAAEEDNVSDDSDIPEEFRATEEYRELLYLKRLKRNKLKEEGGNYTEHIGYKCDRCGCDPIIGTRWHCTDCTGDSSLDFCDECMPCSHETATHNSSHRLQAVRVPTTSYVDSDYTKFTTGDYNYLDPNYLPAS